MLHLDARFDSAVEAAVSKLETRTDAEVVVVAAERSGSYRDISAFAASIGALAVLIVALFVPWSVPPWLLAVELVVAWPLLAWLFNDRWFLRWATPRKRQLAQVRVAAESEFLREAVHGTPHRTGVLVYLSALEGRVELLPDLGIDGRVAPGELAKASEAFSHADLEHFLLGFEQLGDVLERGVPHVEGSDAFDLPNTPRIRAS
jgi:putative membrane protein